MARKRIALQGCNQPALKAGFHPVGVYRILVEAGVARATLNKHIREGLPDPRGTYRYYNIAPPPFMRALNRQRLQRKSRE